MDMKSKLRLQGRYILVNIAMIMAIVIILSSVQLYYFNQNSQKVLSQSTDNTTLSLLEQMHKRGLSVLDYLSEALVNPLYQLDLDATYRLLKPALSNEEILSAYVFDNKGNIFHDGNKVIVNFGHRVKNEAILEAVLEQQKLYSFTSNDSLIIAGPIFIGDSQLGGISLELSLENINQDIALMDKTISATNNESLSQITMSLVGSAILLSVVGIALSVMISRSLISPILTLVKHAKSIGRGEYDAENKINRHDEIGELASAFNEMGHSLKIRTEEISFLAYHDSLTLLPNRNLFVKQLKELLASYEHTQSHFAILLIDLDNFKCVNDNYGHEAGDNLLCEVACRITSNLRHSDYGFNPFEENHDNVLVARIGGDEFLICLPNLTSKYAVSKVTQRLIKAIRSPIAIDKEEVVIAGSIGIAHYPDDGVTAEELIKNADIAMYQAKGQGKNTFSHFTAEMNEKLRYRLEIERELRKGLSDLKQFELWYQPQFDMNNNHLIGAEALIRWRHPEKGLISPDEFIAIAEETGLIIPIGEWVVESACKQIRGWQSFLPHTFHIAVNLSAKQVYRQNAVSVFSKMLCKYQVPASRLHAEVTESLLMQDESEAKKSLDSIRQLGLQVWLDDFGTGYSSLAYLRKFQVDGVKIDRSFVTDIEEDNYDRALTSAVITMAKNLNISVVAEGVETPFHVNFLKSRRCDIGQGYYYSKPLPAGEFEARFFSKEGKAEKQLDAI
ncbi:EAL domain-containing protein [Photobacterium sp. SDRW27]|uniref:bifunctional diguanylate cyclase/phosphodiesterase n=1 Tax=Photobacterium obscurum TaxID=2829490 RepID=UPI00224325F9|nr:EAL domain-containing protein [Photobacterium obscurum]MCW8329101.1 EAL domain-containing protein [Photobacterium obscurum]